MQFIYEGLLGDYPGASNSRYAPDSRNSGMHTYPKNLAINTGGSAPNPYSMGDAAGTAGRMEAEEDNITGSIATELVINKLNEFIKEAKTEEMVWARHSLETLKEFILKNNKPT